MVNAICLVERLGEGKTWDVSEKEAEELQCKEDNHTNYIKSLLLKYNLPKRQKSRNMNEHTL